MSRTPEDNPWWTPPPGHVSVHQAAETLNCTEQAVRKMLKTTPPRLEFTRATQPSGRPRVWINEASLRRVATARHTEHSNHRSTVANPGRDATASPTGVIEAERDQWRIRALRAEHAHLERSAVERELQQATAARRRAEDHLRQYADALRDALDHTSAACDHYRTIIDTFTLPADVSDLMAAEPDESIRPE